MKRRTFLKALCASPLVGLVPTEAAPTIPAPEYPLGTRKVLGDGRVFRYMKNISGIDKKAHELSSCELSVRGTTGNMLGVFESDTDCNASGWAQTHGPIYMKCRPQAESASSFLTIE